MRSSEPALTTPVPRTEIDPLGTDHQVWTGTDTDRTVSSYEPLADLCDAFGFRSDIFWNPQVTWFEVG
jgi:hypothetical protein